MLPLHLQPESHIPLYIQLRDQLRSLVHAGDLRPGDRIPASRELAQMLGVHRTTVANAYAELESEGLIQGHVGRGTFIRNNGNGLKITPPAPPSLSNGDGLRWELLFADERSEEILSRLTAEAPVNSLSFVMARPDPEFFPIEELQACSQAALKREGQDILNLGASDGYAPLKAALLEMLRQDGIPAKDETLLVTDGCQQALDLIAKAFVRPGDTVVMENPTYPGASMVFHGVRAVPGRAGADARGAGQRAGNRSGSTGSDACGESSEAAGADAGFSESDGDFDAPGFAPSCDGNGGAVPGSGCGRPHLRAAERAGRADPFAEATGSREPGDPH